MSTVEWDDLQQLFDRAVDRPPEDRADLYDRDDVPPALREQVESLIAASEDAGDFLERAVDDAAQSYRKALDPHVLIGRRVGAYEIEALVGRGGMGAVYRGRRVDEFDQVVAIKIVQPHVAGGEFLRRFRAERQILARLHHPNIARLLDGGRTDGGLPYYVLEYIEGRAIDQHVREHALGPRDIVRLFQSVCAAVQHAHTHLVVHRDIKPANILVTPDGTPKLLDFGIAKLLTPSHSTMSDTATGLRLMTPTYASPEQVRGETVTISTDVYGLGTVLYELLTGRTAHTFESTAPSEIERVVCQTLPVKPSVAVTSEPHRPSIRKTLAGDLDMIVMMALRKEPERRYGSVAQFADDLAAVLAGRPVRAQPDTWRYRARTFVRRNRAGAAAAAAFAVLLIAFAAAVAVQNARIAEERDTAMRERVAAEQVSGFLLDVFEVSDPSESRGETVTARELLDAGARRIEARLTDQPGLQATMMRVMGDVYATLGLYQQARPLLERALHQHRSVYGDNHEEVATTQLALAVLTQNQGQLPEAGPLFRDALATRQRLFGSNDERVRAVLNEFAYYQQTMGDYGAAEEMYHRALTMAGYPAAEDDAAVAASMVSLGRLLRQLDRYDEAEPLLRDGLAMQRRLFGHPDLDVASTARNLGALLRDLGSFDEADSLYREALGVRRQLLGELHPEVGTTLNSYSILLAEMGNIDGAIAALDEFATILEHVHDGPHPDLAVALHNQALTMKGAGRLAEADSLFRRSMAVQDAVFAPDHPNRAFPRVGLGQLLMDRDRFAEAVPFLREALQLRRAALPAGHRHIGEALMELGTALAGLNRYAEAEELLVEARDLFSENLGGDDARTRTAQERLDALGRRR